MRDGISLKQEEIVKSALYVRKFIPFQYVSDNFYSLRLTRLDDRLLDEIALPLLRLVRIQKNVEPLQDLAGLLKIPPPQE